MAIYKDSDYVDVVDEVTGEPAGRIPKKWLGGEFGKGLKKAGKKADKPGDDQPVTVPDGEPKDEGWTVPQIDAYAKREGIEIEGTKPEKLALIAAALEARKAQ